MRYHSFQEPLIILPKGTIIFPMVMSTITSTDGSKELPFRRNAAQLSRPYEVFNIDTEPYYLIDQSSSSNQTLKGWSMCIFSEDIVAPHPTHKHVLLRYTGFLYDPDPM